MFVSVLKDWNRNKVWGFNIQDMVSTVASVNLECDESWPLKGGIYKY